MKILKEIILQFPRVIIPSRIRHNTIIGPERLTMLTILTRLWVPWARYLLLGIVSWLTSSLYCTLLLVCYESGPLDSFSATLAYHSPCSPCSPCSLHIPQISSLGILPGRGNLCCLVGQIQSCMRARPSSSRLPLKFETALYILVYKPMPWPHCCSKTNQRLSTNRN
ncbi:hypothetical protein F4811DRAFT_447001 [Daldinia bambusicola]|nr:hypothetical protein F4811DRAFT_447001 [Daldinia bambusicola]